MYVFCMLEVHFFIHTHARTISHVVVLWHISHCHDTTYGVINPAWPDVVARELYLYPLAIVFEDSACGSIATNR